MDKTKQYCQITTKYYCSFVLLIPAQSLEKLFIYCIAFVRIAVYLWSTPILKATHATTLFSSGHRSKPLPSDWAAALEH